MKGSFIPAEYFKSLHAERVKGPASQWLHGWRKFGYGRVLLTWDMWQLAQQDVVPAELCLSVSNAQYAAHQADLLQVQQQGAVLLFVSSKVSELVDLADGTLFTEKIFLCDKDLTDIEMEPLAGVSSLRICFSYEIATNMLDFLLKRMKQQGIAVRGSDYLETSKPSEKQFWFHPHFEILGRQDFGYQATYSVVIPFQDNFSELTSTLVYLRESMLGAPAFVQVVIVDDSHKSDHQDGLLHLLKISELNYVYVRLPRMKARQRGDHLFRAGIARNIGVTVCSAAEVLFLDSDILLGREFWRKLKSARSKTGGPLMARRYFLQKDVRPQDMNFEDIHLGRDSQLSWGGHWEDFYRNSQHEPMKWRWTSTYCLAISKELFQQVGGFRRAFFCYGFEDTDLGYRLQQMGHELTVLDTPVYHLPVVEGRSEYSGDFVKRKELMKKSFAVFMRSSLGDELLDSFRHVID